MIGLTWPTSAFKDRLGVRVAMADLHLLRPSLRLRSPPSPASAPLQFLPRASGSPPLLSGRFIEPLLVQIGPHSTPNSALQGGSFSSPNRCIVSRQECHSWPGKRFDLPLDSLERWTLELAVYQCIISSECNDKEVVA